MASTTFSGPVTATNGFVGAVQLPTFTVATAPSAVTAGAGTMIFVSNGAAGSPVVAFSDGTDFLRADTLAAIAAA
jgi:hypothetical protein